MSNRYVRWSSRVKALSTVKSTFTHCPGIFGRRWDDKVRRYLTIKMLTSSFVIFIQTKQCNLCPEVWNVLFDSAMEVVEWFENETSCVMLLDRSTVRENVFTYISDQTVLDDGSVYLPFVDDLLKEMDTHLLVA